MFEVSDSLSDQIAHAKVGIYKVSFVDQEPKVTAHKQIKNQYTNIITWLKPSKRETVHAMSQRGHFREFINIKKGYICFSHKRLTKKGPSRLFK